MIAELPRDLRGARDRALLLEGFAGGFRRSELAALLVEDLETTPDGLIVRLGRSKTDQEGQGRPVALPYGSDPETCPVRALRSWLDKAGITAGPVFRAIDRRGRSVPGIACADADPTGRGGGRFECKVEP